MPEVLAPGLSYYFGDQFLFDDNIFRLPAGYSIPSNLERSTPRGDHVNSTSVGLNGNWTTDRQNVELVARITRNTFNTYGFLDNTSTAGHVYWNWLLGGHLSGTVGAEQDRELIDFSYARVFARDMVDTSGYHASGRYQLGPRWAMTGSARRSETDHSLAAFSSSDGRSTSGSFGTEYSVASDMTLELQYKYSDGTYAQKTAVEAATQGGFHDNTTQILFHYEPSDKTLLLGNAGYLQRRYTAGDLRAYSGDVWHVGFKWDPSAHTEIQLAAGRDLKSYVDQVNEYFVDDERSIIVNWKPRDYLSLSYVLSWQDESYIPNTTATANGFLREDKLREQKLVLTSSASSWLTLYTSAGTGKRESNDRTFQFDVKTISFAFKASF